MTPSQISDAAGTALNLYGIALMVPVLAFGTAGAVFEVGEYNRERAADKALAETFAQVASNTPDPLIPKKQEALRDLYHYLNKYFPRNADYLVKNRIKLNLSATMTNAAARFEDNTITVNASAPGGMIYKRAGIDQVWWVAQVIDHIAAEKAKGVSSAPMCYASTYGRFTSYAHQVPCQPGM